MKVLVVCYRSDESGCPVISTKNSSIKEIAKDAAILINKVNKETLLNYKFNK